jgi:hypothetical protein
VIYGIIWGEMAGILDFKCLLSQKRLANTAIDYYNTGLEIYGIFKV